MKNLRILFLTSATERVGTYWRAFFLAKHLVKEGHEVWLIASRKSGMDAARKVIDGVNIFSLPSIRGDSNLLLRLLSKILTVSTQALLNCVLEIASDFDILHAFDVMGPQNAMPALISRISRFVRFHKRKIFVDWDDWWGRGGMFGLNLLGLHGGEPEVSFVGPLVTFLEEKVPLCADAVTVINETLRQRALRVGVESENLYVIPNGADTEMIKPLDRYDARNKLNLPTKNPVYGHFGHLDVESFKLLIVAHKKVVRHHPNTTLLLFRLSREFVELSKKIVKSLDMGRNVIYVERQPYHKYILYLAASEVFLLPMQNNLFNRARWPLRLGDYLAAGRPIIATALPEIKRIIGKCGLFVRPGDAEDFGDKILEILENPDLGKKLGKRARELAERKYSWQIVAKELEKAYTTHVRCD